MSAISEELPFQPGDQKLRGYLVAARRRRAATR